MLTTEIERLNTKLNEKIRECDENANKAEHYENEC